MSVTLNNRKLVETTIGALGVVAGVVLKNTSEQSGFEFEKTGSIIFIVGWSIVLYALVTKNGIEEPKSKLSIASVIAIVYSVFTMKSKMKKGEEIEMVYPIMFAAAWMILGYSSGALLAGPLVIISMLKVLPWQRKNGVIDGPGLPLFMAAWGLIIYNNARI